MQIYVLLRKKPRMMGVIRELFLVGVMFCVVGLIEFRDGIGKKVVFWCWQRTTCSGLNSGWDWKGDLV